MGNICCGGYEEEYKHGAWQGGHDDDDDEVSYCRLLQFTLQFFLAYCIFVLLSHLILHRRYTPTT